MGEVERLMKRGRDAMEEQEQWLNINIRVNVVVQGIIAVTSPCPIVDEP